MAGSSAPPCGVVRNRESSSQLVGRNLGSQPPCAVESGVRPLWVDGPGIACRRRLRGDTNGIGPHEA